MKPVKMFLALILCFLTTHGLTQHITMPNHDTVTALIKKYHVPTLGIGIIEKGKLKQAKVFGAIAHHSPAPANTLFNIASLTKPIVFTTTLILISKNQWSLDEPLYHYWVDPDVANDPRNKKLTTRHVLSHQSGLPNWKGHELGGKLSFAFEPGTEWKYSGEGFEYLRQALEHKFKLPIEKLADSLLLKPLQMDDTRFYWDEHMDSSLYANRYHDNGSSYEMETWNTANAANLLLTTVNDYTKFGIAVMEKKGLTDAVYEEMIKKQVQLTNEREFGLGWPLIKGLSNGEYALVHTGRNPGINTIILLLPVSKRGIVIFTNGDNGDQLYKEIIQSSFDLGKEIMNRMK